MQCKMTGSNCKAFSFISVADEENPLKYNTKNACLDFVLNSLIPTIKDRILNKAFGYTSKSFCYELFGLT